jgi:hypothetical protein
MRLSTLIAASSAGIAAAHESLHIPRILGGRQFLSELAAQRRAAAAVSPKANARHFEESGSVEKRQQTPNPTRCGPNFGGASCQEGYCCSSAG